MTDRERLEEIEVKYSILTVSSEKNGIEYTEVDVEDLMFLIQNGFKQADRVEKLEMKLSINTNNMKQLQKKNECYKQRIEELELEVNDWRAEVQKWQKLYKESEESHSETKELLKSIVDQNKRYREALEEISQKRMTYADMAGVLRIAREALGRERATERFEKEYKEL